MLKLYKLVLFLVIIGAFTNTMVIVSADVEDKTVPIGTEVPEVTDQDGNPLTNAQLAEATKQAEKELKKVKEETQLEYSKLIKYLQEHSTDTDPIGSFNPRLRTYRYYHFMKAMKQLGEPGTWARFVQFRGRINKNMQEDYDLELYKEFKKVDPDENISIFKKLLALGLKTVGAATAGALGAFALQSLYRIPDVPAACAEQDQLCAAVCTLGACLGAASELIPATQKYFNPKFVLVDPKYFNPQADAKPAQSNTVSGENAPKTLGWFVRLRDWWNKRK